MSKGGEIKKKKTKKKRRKRIHVYCCSALQSKKRNPGYYYHYYQTTLLWAPNQKSSQPSKLFYFLNFLKYYNLTWFIIFNNKECELRPTHCYPDPKRQESSIMCTNILSKFTPLHCHLLKGALSCWFVHTSECWDMSSHQWKLKNNELCLLKTR